LIQQYPDRKQHDYHCSCSEPFPTAFVPNSTTRTFMYTVKAHGQLGAESFNR